MLASNIGDSGLLILRDGQMLAATPPQQHRFNFPYQVGSKGNPVTAAQVRPLETVICTCHLLTTAVFISPNDGLSLEAIPVLGT